MHRSACRVIDVLPKQWGAAAAADFLQQLQDKAARHQALLSVLQQIQVLHVLDPQALRSACLCPVPLHVGQKHGMRLFHAGLQPSWELAGVRGVSTSCETRIQPGGAQNLRVQKA